MLRCPLPRISSFIEARNLFQSASVSAMFSSQFANGYYA
jgi:hypothetical protein